MQDSQDDESDAEGAEVFKTPMTGKHVKFDSDDYDEFVTPLERPAPKSSSQPTKLDDVAEDSEEEEDEEEDSDDDAPEAVSTQHAAAQSAKAAQAAAKAAEQ